MKVDTFGMVNLVAGRRVVPELIQSGFTPDAVAGEVVSLFGVQSGVGAIEIADVSEIWVRIDVPEDRIGSVALGAPAEVAFGSGGRRASAGRRVGLRRPTIRARVGSPSQRPPAPRPRAWSGPRAPRRTRPVPAARRRPRPW